MISRRHLLLSSLCGASYVGLRALATGLPISLLSDPRRALATTGVPCSEKAQFIVFNTSGQGDPINASVPGTYEDVNIVHSQDPAMAPTTLTLAGRAVTAAAPWATLPQNVLDRTCFFHLMTDTPVHPNEPEVLQLMGATQAAEMLPSLLATELAPCLGTIQAQPISLGARTPSEALTSRGRALPSIPPLALKATLTSAAGPLTDLQGLRDQTLNALYDVYKNQATQAQRAYIDRLVISQDQVRHIRQDLLDKLASIEDDSEQAQILAAVTLIQMKVTPVLAVHFDFGGDNHRDIGLANEAAQTVLGVASIKELMAQLDSAGLADQVLFMSLNVFGRTLGKGNENGRQHNENHQVSIAIGKSMRASVIGGVTPVGKDYGAQNIDSKTGDASSTGDVLARDSLAAFGRTMLTAAGVAADVVNEQIATGTTITAALA